MIKQMYLILMNSLGIQKLLHGNYSGFASGNYVYFKDNEEEPKGRHKVFILGQEPEFTITSPLRLMGGVGVKLFPIFFVGKCLNCG